MRGIPVRVEMGPRDIEANQAVIVRRDTREKITVSIDELADRIPEILDTIQKDMLERARAHREAHTYTALNYDEFMIQQPNKADSSRLCGVETRLVRTRLRKILHVHQDVCHLHRRS